MLRYRKVGDVSHKISESLQGCALAPPCAEASRIGVIGMFNTNLGITI
jgi:hypothetical protein